MPVPTVGTLRRVEYSESLVDLVGNTPLVRLTNVTSGLAAAGARQGRVLQPGRLGEGPDRARHDRGGREVGRAASPAAPSSSRPAATPASASRIVAAQRGYKCVFVMPGQDERGEDRAAARVRRRGRRLPDRRRARAPRVLLLGLRPAGPRDPERVEAEPVRQPDQPARRTTSRPGPRSGSRPRGGSRTSSRASAPAARSAAPAATSRSRSPSVVVVGADPEGSVYSGGTGPAVPRRGRRRGLLAGDVRPHGASTASRRQRRGLVQHDPPPRPRGGAARRRLVRHGGRGGAARSREELGPDDVMVVLLPDGGRGYLSKIFNDEWMADFGFLQGRPASRRSATCWPARVPALPELVHVHPHETVGVGDRDPARVRRLADAGREGGAAGHGRRGRRRGGRARPARCAVHRTAQLADALASGTCPSRCRSSAPASRCRRRWHALETATPRRWCSTTASRSAS